jgi:hypothetical protein
MPCLPEMEPTMAGRMGLISFAKLLREIAAGALWRGSQYGQT